jgi:cell division protein ZapA
MDDNDPLVQVEIFGQTYSLRGGGQAGYLRELAAHVDARMREISETTRTADTLKLAVLTALNIADEYFQLRRGGSRTAEREWSGKAGEFVQILDRFLKEAER